MNKNTFLDINKMSQTSIINYIATLMKKEKGISAMDIQLKLKLTFCQTIKYIYKVQSVFNVKKTGSKFSIENKRINLTNTKKNKSQKKTKKISTNQVNKLLTYKNE